MTIPTRPFESDDDAAQYWLTVLRDGSDDERADAREQLAAIFERRGMLDESIELLSANARAGHASADGYRWLARLFRAHGDEISAMQAAAEAAKLMSRPSPTAPPRPEPAPLDAAAPSKPRPWYLTTPALIGASALCVPPLALVFVWMRPWRQPFKIAASVPLGLWALVWLVSVMTGVFRPSTPSPVTQSTPAAIIAAAQPAPTSPAAAPPAARPAPSTATPKPPEPTATPAPPPLAVGFTGQFKPTLLHVGEKLVVELTVQNKSDRPIEGLRIFSSGPWDKYTIVNVLPSGRFDIGFLGTNFYSGFAIPPGGKQAVSIVAYTNEPGSHEFSFIPNRDTQPLKDEKGENIVIGGKVSVIR
jgi:hypothetical protein